MSTPDRYRKKPVVIEAVQFTGTGDSCTAVTAFFGHPYAGTHRWKSTTYDGGWIITLEGEMEFNPGDWIIRGTRGEFYPCKPDVFADVYEPAGDADPEAMRETATPPPTRRIVCLCGSTRYPDAYTAATKAETLDGAIVVTIGCNLRTDTDLAAQDEACGGAIKERLDNLHLDKIALADEVLVVSDESGYFGDSTVREIAHARALGKPVRFQHPAGQERASRLLSAANEAEAAR